MAKAGDGRRIARVEKEVQQAIAEFLLRDLKNELPGFVTITQVRMSPDLRNARVYVSVLAPGEDESILRRKVAKQLQGLAAEVQSEIGAKLDLRFCPKLTFVADDNTEKVLKVEGILRSLRTERGEGENQ